GCNLQAAFDLRCSRRVDARSGGYSAASALLAAAARNVRAQRSVLVVARTMLKPVRTMRMLTLTRVHAHVLTTDAPCASAPGGRAVPGCLDAGWRRTPRHTARHRSGAEKR